MSEENNFCPNCGEQVAVGEKFCPSCGFNFETREVPESKNQNETSSEQEKFDFKNIDFNNIDFRNLNKKQLGTIGGVIVGLLLLVFLFTRNVSISGTYESDDTLGDPEIEAKFEISRNGKTDIIINDYYEKARMKYTVYLEESGENIYVADTSKGLDIETLLPVAPEDYGSFLSEIPVDIELLGLDIENTTDGVKVAGSLTEIEALNIGFDLREIYVVKHGENLMFEGDILIKR